MVEKKKPSAQSQQMFLREAMAALGMTRAGFAQRVSVPMKTLDRWMAPSDSGDFRNMPEIVWAYVREILAWSGKGA
jgi:hypothetical protein